jgi:predicted permease
VKLGIAGRLFRLLLAIYPRGFRDSYRDDMVRLFTERYVEARRVRRAGRFWMRTAANVAAAGLAERWSLMRRPARQSRPPETRSPGMLGVAHDARYAIRLLRRQPAFSLFVVLTLAIGIGATTAVFSVVDGVLLRPLPFQESDRLVRVWGRFDPESGFDFPEFPLSNPEFLDYKTHTRALEDLAAFAPRAVTVGGPGADPERVPAAAVTGNLFSLLRVAPALGRTFAAAEMAPGAPTVVVLSHDYWQARFGGDRAILGRTVPLNGSPVTVIGVMPGTFAFPRPVTRLWLPLPIDPASPGGRSNHSTYAIGRLAPGVDIASARAELQALMNDWKTIYPQVHTGHYLFIRSVLEDVAGDIRPALLLLLGATGVVLLIVCANVASVVLARGEARTREMAIRGALGAGRRRLLRLALIESGILAVAGGVCGFALASALVRAMIAIDPASIPRATELGPDVRMALFALTVSAVCAGLVGLMPAIPGARADLQSALREASVAATGGAHRLVFRRALVTVEVGLAVVLVLGAGLMLRSFAHLVSVEPGFRPAGLVTANVTLPVPAYPEPSEVESFYDTLVGRLEAMRGVTSASAGTTVPLWSGAGNWDFEIEAKPAPAQGQPAWNAKAVIVRPGYFETLGVPLVRGRLFTADDHARSQPVAVISEPLARRFFAGEDPIGRRLRISGRTGADAWMTVVGISGSVRTDGLDAEAPPAFHFLHSQLPRTNGGTARSLSILVRTEPGAGVETVVPAIRTAVRELDPSLALYDVQTAESVIERSVARPRFTTSLLGLFAGLGLLLGASGIYGVLAYTVARRTQEIGIRRALGAPPGRLAAQVVADGMGAVGLGLALGLVVSHWATRFWSTQLFGVSPADPVVYAAVVFGVGAIALAAMAIPVRRALRVSPLAALRSE